MRIVLICGAAAAMALAGCAAPMGEAAGNVVGGAAWAGVKGSKLAFKGGKFAARTTGRTVKGAAVGIHDEFSRPKEAEVQQVSQRETADLPY
jgi:hypothetical protein